MEEDSHDRKYKIDAGQELALVCHGTGDPEPELKWRREVSILTFQKDLKLLLDILYLGTWGS